MVKEQSNGRDTQGQVQRTGHEVCMPSLGTHHSPSTAVFANLGALQILCFGCLLKRHFLSGAIALEVGGGGIGFRVGFYPCEWQPCFNKHIQLGKPFVSICDMNIIFTWKRVKPRKHHEVF